MITSINKRKILKRIIILICLIFVVMLNFIHFRWRRDINYDPNLDNFFSSVRFVLNPRVFSTSDLKWLERPRVVQFKSAYHLRHSGFSDFAFFDSEWAGLEAFTVFSNAHGFGNLRGFEVIYEVKSIKELRTLVSHFAGSDSQPLSSYIFEGFGGRRFYYFFDINSDAVPKIYYDLHDFLLPRPIQFASWNNESDFSWIGIRASNDNQSFALFDYMRPNKFYREILWDSNKFIIDFHMLSEDYAEIIYIDKTKIFGSDEMLGDIQITIVEKFPSRWSTFMASMEEIIFSVDDEILGSIWRIFGEDYGFYTFEILIAHEILITDEISPYVGREIVPLNNYITSTPPRNYRYEFMLSADISERITRRIFTWLRVFMSRERIIEVFQTEGEFIKEEYYEGLSFITYGFMGRDAVIFATFHKDILVEAEFINPHFYNGRGAVLGSR